MKIYDTKEEAQEEAGRLVSMLQVPTTEDDSGDSIIVTDSHSGRTLSEFNYRPERVAPANGQAVMCSNGTVFYSRGMFDDDWCLLVYCDTDGKGRGFVSSYTPVDIIPAGQFAKAVELLEIWLDTCSGGNDWTRETSALLDEIKAGGE